ncbi:MFS transporter [Clostridium fungisolvens]|uniref:Enterobactin exporter EntS n=1 Tax=Clostridium fungisolvens TaxID=1604897 RepID=A0A6V8SLK8_9CLOT|nr:MFS transporter [Clostridium fungisolvens]GFP77780.1 Enterobactin exporter EntS [Clostridium fungisolvens]
MSEEIKEIQYSNTTDEGASKSTEKLWNKNFFLLWQGQLVSCFGDAIYEIALGFWVLAVTGSSALMGTIMAITMIPRIAISPFAGVWVDRANRKLIIILADLIRGVAIVSVGFAIYKGVGSVWMVMAAGIVLGLCSAFFGPSISSVLPDLVPKERLLQANSSYQMSNTGANLMGTMAGGAIFSILGAPIMFLLNGFSYLFSGFLELFLKVPKVIHKKEKSNFKEDFVDGLKFSIKFKGLRNIIILACVINFFAQVGFVLLMPYFNSTPGLDAKKYGLAMGIFTLGMISGMLTLSIIKIAAKNKFFVFVSSGIISMAMIMIAPITENIYAICILLFIAGALNAILNTLLNTTAQLIVPQDMRGKVFALIGTFTQALSPIGMVIGGVLGGILGAKQVICGSFGATLLFIICFAFMKSVKKVINYDPEKQAIEEIM